MKMQPIQQNKNNNHVHLIRHTKIIATLGPATDNPEVLTKIIEAGVNVVRLNFSHGTHNEHLNRIKMVREIAKQQKRVVGILADLQGPKIRIAKFEKKKIFLKANDTFILDAELDENSGNEETVGIDYKKLPDDVSPKDILLLYDVRIELEVTEVSDRKIICRIIIGGFLSNHKGINRKGGGLSAEALTNKDKKDLAFAVAQGVDLIAISFPRSGKDIELARSLIPPEHQTTAIIAKIERTEAVNNLEEIIRVSNGVMVARGDLAVEIGDAQVPLVQKRTIQLSRSLDKPVIIATQMMESMISSSVPTRAEVSDVANAVLDYTDAVMLSAETAAGEYPTQVVSMMSQVCLVAEQQPDGRVSGHRIECRFQRVDEAIAMATMYTANHLKDIKAIIALTESGDTALWMSRIKSAIPIYGLSRHSRTLGKMALYRGVFPIYFNVTECSYDEVNHKAIKTLNDMGLITKKDTIILTKGDYIGIHGLTNAMKILRVDDVI